MREMKRFSSVNGGVNNVSLVFCYSPALKKKRKTNTHTHTHTQHFFPEIAIAYKNNKPGTE